MANSGKKTPTNLFRLWKVYMRTRWWPIDCPEMNTPFIECQNTLRFALGAQVEMFLKKTRHHSPGWCYKGPSVSARMAILLKFMCCNKLEESIGQAFFDYCVQHPLCTMIESYMIHVLDRKFFVLKACSVYANVVLLLKRDQHYVLLCQQALSEL